MTLVFWDETFLAHDTGSGHPESSARLVAVAKQLRLGEATSAWSLGQTLMVGDDDLRAVHAERQIAMARDVCAAGGGHLDADTVVSEGSFRAALYAAGTCVAAVDAVIEGKAKTASALVRPPGHHANQNASSGFCVFNNVAVAARHAQRVHKIGPVLIVDWDVHHGNGTQDIFYQDPSVFLFSIHRFPFYPGTGDANETGAGKGLGTTLNVPVKFGTSRVDYLAKFRQALEAAAERMRPELILISAGFDAHRADPIGSLGLETEDFGAMTRSVVEMAATFAQGRVVSCLEGGYNLRALAESVEVHLEALN